MLKFNDFTKNKPILICGGTGLVGSALLRKFIEKGFTNLHATYNIHKPYDYEVVIWHKVELKDKHEVKRLFDKMKPYWVVIAAAKVGGILANNTYRAEFIYDNLMIQNHVIHQSYLSQVKKLLFLGSSCIYPKDAPQPMPEECLLTGELEYTNEPYAIAKIAGIKMCESYNLQYGTNFLAVMPTNLYGPNDNFDLEKSHVLPALIRKLHIGKCLMCDDWNAIRADVSRNPIEGINGSSSKVDILNILDKYGISYGFSSNRRFMIRSSEFEKSPLEVTVTLWGTGAPRREFLYSDDMADACIFILGNVDFKDTYDKKSKEVRNTHINIGSGKDISIRDLVNTVKNVVGYKGSIIFDDSGMDGAMKKKQCVEKIERFGWKYKKGLDEGVELYYSDYLRLMNCFL